MPTARGLVQAATDFWQAIPEALRDPVALAAPFFLLAPWQLLCDVRAAPTLRQKLGYVFGPPGWRPVSAPSTEAAPASAL